jgi:epoxyqueuosine reductase
LRLRGDIVKAVARECGFELAGVARADPVVDFRRYEEWVAAGRAGEMGYLTGRRGAVRGDPRELLSGAKSIICVGKLYNHPEAATGSGHGIVSQYAWGPDYHVTMRAALEELASRLQSIEACDVKVCVDTAPLLERSYARLAGLGWIGKNTCLINEPLGSWFFLGEIITTLEIEVDSAPPDRCGTCTRCIDACPTGAIVAEGTDGAYTVDSRRCISYFTIELRGTIPEEHRAEMGTHIFGCDICQDVCPWNSRAPVSKEDADAVAPALKDFSYLSPEDFHLVFRETALARAKYTGMLRNVAVAMGNSGLREFEEPLKRLAAHADATVAEHGWWGLKRLSGLLEGTERCGESCG